MLHKDCRKKLETLANKYEVSSFCDSDPSQFLHWYDKVQSVEKVPCTELASFIAAMLAFGNRRQFIPKIEFILNTADKTSGNILNWLKTGRYKSTFPSGSTKFYRFYSYDDMQVFFTELSNILQSNKTPGQFFKSEWEKAVCSQSSKNHSSTLLLSDIISASFPQSRIVPKGHSSANKRIHMFLRWMVRRNSPVDLGLWTWYSPANLIIPLDVHVLQEAKKLRLLPQKATASRKTAVTLTQAMEEIFPGDPCRADYALFGLGVDN